MPELYMLRCNGRGGVAIDAEHAEVAVADARSRRIVVEEQLPDGRPGYCWTVPSVVDTSAPTSAPPAPRRFELERLTIPEDERRSAV